MKKRLQDISFRVSRYFRPLEPWHCGGLENGERCLLGPDRKGRCRAITECKPEKYDHTWKCTRGELLGGKCRAGPSPQGGCGQQRKACKPVPNLRARRQRVAWIAMIAVLASLTIGFSFNSWKSMIMPGPLSVHHLSFGTDDCDSCHQAASQPRSSWFTSLFGNHPSATDSKNCIACHQIGEVAENPHSLAGEQLQQLSTAISSAVDQAGAAPSANLVVDFALHFTGEAAENPNCTVCHQEHTGSDNITAVSNQQCAVCHTQAFADFAAHSSFTNYPANRRTPIVFSHNTHFGKHFLEEDSKELAPQNCLDCHRADSLGEKMEVRGFASTCSSCHLGQITGENRTSAKGIAMLSFPAVDTETLRERGVDIGSWPEASDAELTPLNLLLMSLLDPELSTRLARLRELDLYDLRDASDADLELVYQGMWELKRSYFEMQRGGAQAILNQMQNSMVTDVERAREVLGLLSPDLIDSAIGVAFPNLSDEVSQWLVQGIPAFRLNAKIAQPPETAEASPDQATAEDDDWLASAAGSDDDDDWLSEAAEDESDDDWLDEAAANDETDDWLDEATAGSDAIDDGDDWLDAAAGDDADSLDDDWLEDALDEDSASTLADEDIAVQPMDESDSQLTVPELLTIEDRAAAGGWYFEDFYLRYRPSGHADRLIVAWVELLLANSELTLQSSLMNNVLGEDSPGNCIKCHSIDSQQVGTETHRQVNWLGKKTSPTEHGFNTFAHQSHIAVIKHANSVAGEDEVDGCQSCHKTNSESDSGAAYADEKLADFESDFYNLEKSQCIDCHQPETRLANCTQCHNYHIGERTLVGMKIGFQSEAGKVKQTFSTQAEATE